MRRYVGTRWKGMATFPYRKGKTKADDNVSTRRKPSQESNENRSSSMDLLSFEAARVRLDEKHRSTSSITIANVHHAMPRVDDLRRSPLSVRRSSRSSQSQPYRSFPRLRFVSIVRVNKDSLSIRNVIPFLRRDENRIDKKGVGMDGNGMLRY